MNILSVDNLSKSFGERWLFQGISFGLNQGQKAALVGANGTGKSTLLKTIMGILPADEGEVTVSKDARLGYVLQDPDLDNNLSIKDCILQHDNPLAVAIREYQDLLNTGDTGEAFQESLVKMENLKAWDFEAKVGQVTGKLGLHDLELSVGQLSGGQKKRVALAQMLLAEPDFIILDEPTNHLDIEAIEWLEGYLSVANATLLMVTHDRYFMDNVTNSVFELDRGNIYWHMGNYGKFLENKAERMAIEATEVDKAKNLYKTELNWMRRQPKARGTKAKYRIDAFHDLKKVAHKNISTDKLEIDVKTARQGRKILELHDIFKSFADKKMIDSFSYIFRKQDRIGIVGKNGVGKSTFLNVLTQKIEVDQGEVIYGQTTKVGYFTQEITTLNPENRVIEEVKEIAEFIELGSGDQVSVSKFLDMFLFPPEKQYTYIGKLSGGERKRLQLLKVLVSSPNFLILDEPTNDLDIDTMNVLETYLESFPGCLMIVSHDRYFMDRLTDHLFVFEGDGVIRDFNGNYSDYREEQVLREKEQKKGQKNEESALKTKTETRKLSFKEKKEMEELETKIEKLESHKEKLVEEMNSGITDHTKLSEISSEIEQVTSELEEIEMRWLELSEVEG